MVKLAARAFYDDVTTKGDNQPKMGRGDNRGIAVVVLDALTRYCFLIHLLERTKNGFVFNSEGRERGKNGFVCMRNGEGSIEVFFLVKLRHIKLKKKIMHWCIL